MGRGDISSHFLPGLQSHINIQLLPATAFLTSPTLKSDDTAATWVALLEIVIRATWHTETTWNKYGKCHTQFRYMPYIENKE